MRHLLRAALAYRQNTDPLPFPLDRLPTPPPIVHGLAQRSEAWHALRCGKLTGSHAYDLIPRRDPAHVEARRALRARLIQEQRSGRPARDRFASEPMRYGLAHEAAVRAAYAHRTGVSVHTTGFVAHPTLQAGASLDGHVGPDVHTFEGLVEIKIKAPTTTARDWQDRVRELVGKLPLAYEAQIVHQLWLTGAQWADVVAWDATAPPQRRLHVVRITRTAALERAIVEYDRLARALLAEVERAVAITRFFESADLHQAREVLRDCTRALALRGGITLPAGGVA